MNHWYGIRWPEWVGVVGVLLTLAGLFLTWMQASRATQAAEAASRAVESTRQHLSANQLLVLVPQLRGLAGELDAAIEADDASLTRRHLDSWRWSAGFVHGVLSGSDASEGKVLTALQDSVALAFSANGKLLEGKRPVLDACRQARQSIGLVCNQLTIWVGQQSSNVHSDGEGSAKS